jgi:predicted kinase
MRKWMRERLQRRKKKTTELESQPAPPPLQPAYFEADQPPASEAVASEPEVALSEPELDAPSERAEPSTEAPPAEPEGRSAAQPSGKRQAPQRARRRRGGRGRGGRGREQAVAQAFTLAAAKGVVPDVPAEVADDEVAPDIEPEVAAAAIETPKPPAAPVPTQRPPKGIVVLAIGLPGSGKSTWFKRHNVVPLSSDMVRSLLFDDIREQRFQDLVFSNLRSMLKARLIAKRPMNYVDATNLTPQERQHWIKLAKDYNYEVHAVFFDVPLEVCIERHQRRDRVVPEDVMRRMAAKLKPPAFTEGFAKITVVRVKKKE